MMTLKKTDLKPDAFDEIVWALWLILCFLKRRVREKEDKELVVQIEQSLRRLMACVQEASEEDG
jgi:hypothetical protein